MFNTTNILNENEKEYKHYFTVDVLEKLVKEFNGQHALILSNEGK